MKIFSGKQRAVSKEAVYKMITDVGNGIYVWNGKMYQSDIVRACIRPQAKAVGKLAAKHVRKTTLSDGKTKIDVNPVPYIRFLLEEPNEIMTGQMMQEKMSNQLDLNGNAFALIIKDEFGLPIGMWPISCNGVEAKYNNNILYLKFYYLNGKSDTFPYSEIIHLRNDFCNDDLFGENQAEAITSLMNVIGTIDKGIINAVKNGGVIKWLLKYTSSIRDDDLKKNAKRFVDNFLDLSNSSLGVAATDAKADVQQIEPHDYVPNAAQTDRTTQRIYDFFNTNKKIVTSDYTENEWISYYEGIIEPRALQYTNEYTRKIFSRRERGCGNQILFESSNLTYASMQTKLNLVQYVDRGIMTPNEVREILNLAPVNGGDIALLRKDTGTLEKGGE